MLFMAVPKKKGSRSKRDSRRFHWNQKILKKIKKAISLAKSTINDIKGNFIIE
jgi:large subunit ribosomal protein L32